MIVTEGAADTVLIVEGDTPFRRSLTSRLRGGGYVVVEAPDAEIGLDLVRFHGGAIAWLIIDLEAPGSWSSLHAILEYRFLNPLRPVICVASDGTPASFARIPDLIHFSRPVRVGSLLRELDRIRQLSVAGPDSTERPAGRLTGSHRRSCHSRAPKASPQPRNTAIEPSKEDLTPR